MSLIQNIYGSLFVNNNITGDTLTLSSITNDDSLTQILARNNDGLVEYVDVNSIITGATTQDTFVTGFTYNNANTFTIANNDGGTFSATINNVTGLTSNGNVEVIGNLIVTGGTGNVLTKQVYVENNLGLDWDFPSSSVVLGNNSDGTIINGTSLTINSDTLVNGTLTATTFYGDGSNLTGIDNFYVSGGTYNLGTNNINFSGNNVVTTFDVDLSSLISSVSGDTFVVSGNADVATSQLTFTNNSGGTFNVTNSAALFSDNDINVTGGTYNPSNGCVTFTTNSGTTFDVCGFLTGFTNTFVTGFTYNDANTFTISRNDGVDLSASINTMTGLTVNGSISATTYFGDGSNLTGISTDDNFVTGGTLNSGTLILERQNGIVTITGFTTDLDTYVTGGTVSISATDSDNSGTIGLFYKNSDGIPRTLPFEDTFTTGATYDNGTALATFKKNDGTSYTLNLSSLTGGTSDTNSFSTGGTVTQTATSGSSEVIVQIVGNDGFTPYNITGLTDTFINDFSFSSNTFTITQNNGSTFEADVDTIDLANILSAVTFNIATTGTISATTFNGGTFNGTFVGDGSGLTGITDNDTFVTGTTFASNQITLTRNDNVDVFSLSGGSNVTLSETATNDILIDVSLPPSMNTYVTGGTYNESTDTITLTRNDAVTVDITGITDTFTTGSTYDNGTALATFTKNDGTTYTLDLSTIDVNDTFVTGFTYNDANTLTISRNDGVDLNTSINTVTALTVTNYIDYTTGTKPSAISGRTYFDRDENALSYFPDTPANDVTINIGQESVIRVHNNTGVQINNGQVCHITSEEPSVNGVPSVILAVATGDTTTGSRYLVSGVATHDIPNGTEGFITSFGLVRDLNITGVTEGTEIYLSESTPGAFRYTAPDTEFRRSVVGYVVTTGATTGKILVTITNEVGFSELSESLLSVVTENNASTGTRDGGEITINGGDNTLFDISAGSGIIVDNYTDPNAPTIQNIVWDSITGNSVTNLTGDSASYIFLDSNTNTVQFGISNPPTEADYRDNIFLGIVGHANFTNLINVFNTPIQIVSPINQHQDLTSAIGPFSINGNRVSNITGTLELQKSVGKSYFYGGNFHTDTKVPSSITTAQLSGSTLIYAKGTAVLGPTSTDIDPNNYDPDGLGVITAVPGTNQYVAHRIWHQPSQNLLIFQYGQEFYPNAATARDEFEFESYVVPPGLNETSYLVAIVIAQDGDTDLDSATIIPQGKFAGTGGGGGSAADTLQTAYNNSSSPEIITDATRGAVDFRVGSGSDSDNVVTFQQNSGAINAFVEGTGDAKFTNLTGTSVTSNSAINVFNGHINIRDNSYFLQGRTVADVNVSLIGVDSQDKVLIGNTGYDTYIDSDTIVDGVLSAQTAFLTTTPTLNNSATDILVRNSSTGEVEYRPVSGITPDTNTFVTGGTYSDVTDTITLTRNDGVTIDITGVTDNFVIAGTYSDSTDTISLLRNDGDFVNITGITDNFVTGGTYNDTTNNINFSGNSAETTFDVDLTSLVSSVSANTFVIGGAYVDSTDTLALLRNDGDFVNITGITDTFTTGATYDNGTALATFNRNDGNSYTLDLSTIDVNDTFSTGGTVTQSSSNNENNQTIQIVGNDGFTPYNITNITDTFTTGGTYDNGTALITFDKNDGTTYDVDLSTLDLNDTFVTGTTFGSNQATVTRNDGTDVLLLTGGTNVTLSNPSTNQIKIDVTSPLNITIVSTTTYNATINDEIIGVDTSSNAVTIRLPDSISSGTLRYEIKDIGFNSRSNPITIQAVGSDSIRTTSLVSSFTLSADGGAVVLINTATREWWQM